MATITIIKGQTTYIDPQIQYADSGWVVDGKYAVHYPCFGGTMEYLPALPFLNGISYDIEYFVDQYISGSIHASLGASSGASHALNGKFTDTFTYHTGDKLTFYSDGSLRLILLNMAIHQTDVIANGQTFAFNETGNIWVADYSYQPENIIRFTNKLFSFTNGTLWQHDTNAIAGMFYGVKYPARFTIAVNTEYLKDKIWYNLRLDANGSWYMPSALTSPSNQFPNGMMTRLKSKNLSLIDGKLWGAILGDITDVNFQGRPLVEALFNGRKMQGGWLILTMECNDNSQSELSSLELYYIDVLRDL